MGKTYRKVKSQDRQKERNHKFKEFRLKRKIIKELENNEQTEEMSEMQYEVPQGSG
jgi:hypothetical protein|tara:strand:+ start:691 stop:858 length:168 start_codon:yes stop_codon:yes gene_type:complete